MIRRVPKRHHRHPGGLGYPVLPDGFDTASGAWWAFSPNTPDAIMMQILTASGQQLPADLAAKWAAAQAGTQITPLPTPVLPSGTVNPAPAVNPSGEPVSTQTGAPVRVLVSSPVATGVWLWTMSDGSSHYGDQFNNPVMYTPPTPSVTPAAGSTPVPPTQTQVPGSTATAPPPAVAVTPGGTPISTVTTLPVPQGISQPAPAASSSFDLSGIMTWLQASMIGGIPNWMLVAGGAAAVMMFSGNGTPHRKGR